MLHRAAQSPENAVKSDRSISLDLLRAAAIFFVLGRHLEPAPAEMPALLRQFTNIWYTGGWVGVELDRPGGEEYGPMTVTRVVEGSPAESAGIQAGDLLIAMNGIELAEGNDEKIKADRASWKPGSSVTWTMQRDGADRNLAITLAPMPADILAAYIGKHMLEHASAELAQTP